MANHLTKLNVARHQLGTALDLFIRDRDPIAVHCLACGGGELIEAIADVENVQPLTAHMLETIPSLDMKELRRIQRLYWNAFKHMTQKKGERATMLRYSPPSMTGITTQRYSLVGGTTRP